MSKLNNKKTHNRIPPRNRANQNGVWWWVIIALTFLILLNQTKIPMDALPKDLSYSEFYSILKDNDKTGKK